ncbi:MAG: HU family DNA-binding protein [Tannerella sp.]|nr:HU family DNA-binding protein [Tannerella sp.]
MNERLTTRNLVDILVIQTGMTKGQAENFIDALSSYITQGIEKNKAVKILGLGTFKVVLVRERESVHIHTGERFVIPAHHKLSFIPDRNFKEHINRPFAFFEPIEAAENIYSLSSNKQIADDNDENDIEYEVDDHKVETVKPTETFNDDEFLYSDDNLIYHYMPKITEEQPIVEMEDKVIPEADESPIDTGSFQHVPENVRTVAEKWPASDENDGLKNYYESNNKRKKSKTVAPLWLWFLLLPFLIVTGIGIATYVFLHYNANTFYNNVASSMNNNSTLLVDQYYANETTPLPIGAQRTPDSETPINMEDNLENGTELPANATNVNEMLTRSDGENLTDIADSVKNNNAAGSEKSNENKRVIDWLALSSENTTAESKTADRQASATTSKPTPKQTEQKNSNKTTASTTTTAAKPKAPAEKTIPARVRMTAGSSLTQIAMEHYGDKVFWVYIYDYNKSRIKDFNNIPVGMEIRLPQPNVYDINAKNRTSVQKARKKQSELLKWDKWDDYQ